MSELIDIVNFNADASCLESAKWLSILGGGSDSLFCQWLNLYTDHEKPMVLGLTGATVSDLLMMNSDAIKIIRAHPKIFQIILRPYSHDISILRTPESFIFNLAAGKSAIEDVFGRFNQYFLPPEFMFMSEQISILSNLGIQSTFINPNQFSPDIVGRLPKIPYYVQGILGSELGCIPVTGDLTQVYLKTIQLFQAEDWNNFLQRSPQTIFFWRDGESPFLIPDGIKREEFWLNHCTANRVHLGKEIYERPVDPERYHSYPMNSFSPWMKELRMLGFLRRTFEIEKHLHDLPPLSRYLWLLTINSDILSAVEKKAPVIQLRKSKQVKKTSEFMIPRSERGFEGEEYLALLEKSAQEPESVSNLLTNSQEPHLIKARMRITHLTGINP
jgi:hypothetical protein